MLWMYLSIYLFIGIFATTAVSSETYERRRDQVLIGLLWPALVVWNIAIKILFRR